MAATLCSTILLFTTLWISSIVTVLSAENKSFEFLNKEGQLIQHLLKNYYGGYHTRPVTHAGNSVNISFGISMINIFDLNEKDYILDANTWMKLMWNDPRLKWDPKDYDNIQEINLDSELVWRPDIVLYNGHGVDEYLNPSTKVVVMKDGLVVWVPPRRMRVYCPMNLFYFPYDIQVCTIKYGSWTHHAGQLRLNFMPGSENSIDTQHFLPHQEWVLTSTKARINRMFYPGVKNAYEDVTYNIILKRFSLFYNQVFILPAVMMAFVIPFVFIMEPGSSQKTVLTVGVMLCYTLLLNYLQTSIGGGHLIPPLLAIYYASMFIISNVSLVLSLLLSLAWTSEGSKRPSGFVLRGIRKMGRFCCLKVDYERLDDNEPGPRFSSVNGDEDVVVPRLPPQPSARSEWKIVIQFVERLLFFIFTLVTVITTLSMLGQTDPRDPGENMMDIKELIKTIQEAGTK